MMEWTHFQLGCLLTSCTQLKPFEHSINLFKSFSPVCGQQFNLDQLEFQPKILINVNKLPYISLSFPTIYKDSCINQIKIYHFVA